MNTDTKDEVIGAGLRRRFVVQKVQGRYGVLDRIKNSYAFILPRRKSAAVYAQILNRDYGYTK